MKIVRFKKTIYFEIPITEKTARETRNLKESQKTKPSDYRAAAVQLCTDIIRKYFPGAYIFPRGREYVFNEDGTEYKNEYHYSEETLKKKEQKEKERKKKNGN